MGEHRGSFTTWPCCHPSSRRLPRGLENYPVCFTRRIQIVTLSYSWASALSEVVGSPLPYDDVLSLRDRMWEISPTLLRYDTTEPTSVDVALVGLKALASATANAKVTGEAFKRPIDNFYQTDPISRACVFVTPDSQTIIDVSLDLSPWLNVLAHSSRERTMGSRSCRALLRLPLHDVVVDHGNEKALSIFVLSLD